MYFLQYRLKAYGTENHEELGYSNEYILLHTDNDEGATYSKRRK